MKYVHLLLGIPHHQLKVNRKFNVNFNLNLKYNRVKGKQKVHIFNMPTPLSPTTSPPPQPQPLPWPPLPYYAFPHPHFWKLKKLETMMVNNTDSRHMVFLRFEMKMASPQKLLNISLYILCSLYSTQLPTTWFLTSFKKFWNDEK